MPSWKKVITSGSNATLAQISASVVPTATTQNLLAIDSSTGGIMQITQSGASGINTFANTGVRVGNSIIDGNLGIGPISLGTSFAQKLLHISSSGHSMVEVETSADNKKAGIRFDTLRTGAGMGGSELYKSGSYQYWSLDSGMFWNSNGKQTMAAENSGIKFFSSSAANAIQTEFARFDIDTKRLGIGTTSPEYSLDIQGNSPVLRIADDNVVNSPSASAIWMGENGGTEARGAGLVYDGFNNTISLVTTNNGSAISNPYEAQKRLTIQESDGNVGIGITSPSQMLHISGASGKVRIEDQDHASNGTPQLYIEGNKNNALQSAATLIEIKSNLDVRGRGIHYTHANSSSNSIPSSDEWFSGVPYQGSGFQIGFDKYNGIPWYKESSSLFINEGGSVGIGTTGPTTKLHLKSPTTTALTIEGATNNSKNIFFSKDGNVNEAKIREHAGTLGFFTGGDMTDANMFITSESGNVGIGTTSPTYKLHVSSSAEIVAKFVSSDNKAAIQIKDNDTTGYVSAENSRIAIGPSSGTHANNINIKTDNYNVGIGTTSPTEKLQVSGSISASGDLLLKGPSSRIHVVDSDDGNYSIELLPTNGPMINFGDTDNALNSLMVFGAFSGTNNINTKTRDFHLFGTNTTTGFYFLENTGKFGIGTTSPSATLHITSSNNPNLLIEDPNGSQLLRLKRTDNNKYFNLSLEGDDLRFIPGTTDGSQNIIIGSDASSNKIDSRLGIGTATPNVELEVSGSISASGDLEARNITASNIQVTNDIALGGNIFSFSGFSFIEGVSAVFTGSNVFGSGSTPGDNDTAGGGVAHQFTGSVSITGSGLTVVGGGLSADLANVTTPNFVVYNTSTGALTHTNPGLISGSAQIASEISGAINSIISVDTFKSTGQRSGDSAITGSLELSGSGHLTASGNISASGTITGLSGSFNTIKATAENSPNEGLFIHANGSDSLIDSKFNNLKLRIFRDSDDIELQTSSSAAVGPTTKLFISSSGNVGIGTTTPSSKLHLKDGNFRITSEFPRIYLQDSNNDSDFSIINGNGNLRFYDDTNAVDRLYIKADGNVGIGTTTPTEKLQVEGNISASGNLHFGDSHFLGDDDDDNLILSASAGENIIIGTPNSDIFFRTGSGTAMTIKSTGNVGIGTTNPSHLLEVRDGNFEINNGNLKISHSSAGGIGGQFEEPNTDLITFRFDSDRFRFWGGGYERLTILSSSGNIGIGTTTPGEALEVVGNISASGIISGSTANLTSAAGAAPLLTLHNTTNGGSASIDFSDIADGSQRGTINFQHANGASQGGNASFHIGSTETDMVLVVGGRILATASNSNAEVDYGFIDDIDTGMMRPAADSLRLVAGGTNVADMSSGQFTVTGELEATTLDINGAADISGDLTTTQITASGNVSASGHLFASLSLDNSNLSTVMYNTTTGQFFHTGSYGGGGGLSASTISGSWQGQNFISSSGEIATDISGAIDAATSSLLSSYTFLSSSAQIATDISGAFSSPFTAAGISGSWQGENFISASQTFLSTGQRNGNSGITGSLELSGIGHLTSSGNISASGTGSFSKLNIDNYVKIEDGDVLGYETDDLSNLTYSLLGSDQAGSLNLYNGGGVNQLFPTIQMSGMGSTIFNISSKFYVGVNTTGKRWNNSVTGGPSLSTDTLNFNVLDGIFITGSSPTGKIWLNNGHITASGNISASGDLEVRNITASNIQVANDIALGGNIFSFSGFSFIEGVSANFTGSNKFGSGSTPAANDTAGGGAAHQFTGSVAITGSGLSISDLANATTSDFVVYNTSTGALTHTNPGLISGSAQIATDISGAIDAATSSLLSSYTFLSSSAQIATDISGAIDAATSSLLSSYTFLSSSAQIATDISGAIDAATSSLLSSYTFLSSSAQIATDISGAFSSPFTAAGISGSWQGENFISASQTFLSTGQRSGDSAITGSLELSGSGHLTASGNISASGNLFASLSLDSSALNTVMYNTSTGQFFHTGSYGSGGGGGITGIVIKEDDAEVSGGPFTTLDFHPGTVSDDGSGEAKIRFSLADVTDVDDETGNGATFFKNKIGSGFRYGLNPITDPKIATSGFESDGANAKTLITPQHTTLPFYFIGHGLKENYMGGEVHEYPDNYIVFNEALGFFPDGGGGDDDGPAPDDWTQEAFRPGLQINGNLQLIRYQSSSETGSEDRRGGVLIGNSGVSFFNTDTLGSNSGSLQIASASAQIKFNTGSSALKVFAGSTNEDLLEVMHISRSGANPRIGIGTNNPLKAFDFKSVSDDNRGGELLIRGSRTTKGADVSDEVGRINFSIDSSSFNDITTSGSAAEIVALVDEVDTTGVKGHLSFRISNAKTGEPAEIFKLSGSKSILSSPLDVGTLTPGSSDINASTINRYNNTSTRIELAANHIELRGNAYNLKAGNTGVDINPSSLTSLDFRVRSSNDTQAIFVDSGLDSIQLGSNANTHVTASGNVSGSAASTASFGSLKIDGASVDFSGLPTSDPGVAGRLWNDSNTLKISAG